MKVEIKYKFKTSHYYPFIAMTVLDGEELVGLSDVSFDLAKAELIANIKDFIETKSTGIPEPEEVEV